MAEQEKTLMAVPFGVDVNANGQQSTRDALIGGMGLQYNNAFMRFGQRPEALRPWVNLTREQAALQANMMDMSAFMPNVDPTSIFPPTQSFVSVNGRNFAVNAGILLKDEWAYYDAAVLRQARNRLVGVADLIAAGCVLNVPNALGTTVLEYEKAGFVGDVAMDMDATTRTTGDLTPKSIEYLPLPIIHAGFSLSIRELMASRKKGMPLDTTEVEGRTRKIAEYVEGLLFNGISGNFQQAGGYIYGYSTHPKRIQYTSLADWGSSGVTGAEILNDVLNMKQQAINYRHYGPYTMYIPTAYETILDDDFKAESDKTIRQRIMEVGNINNIKVADHLTDDNVIMVELKPETVRMVVGFQPMVLEWQSMGGMKFEYKIMTIMVPQIRADYGDYIGLVHGTTS